MEMYWLLGAGFLSTYAAESTNNLPPTHPPPHPSEGWNCSRPGQIHDVAIYNYYEMRMSVYNTYGENCGAAWPGEGRPFDAVGFKSLQGAKSSLRHACAISSSLTSNN